MRTRSFSSSLLWFLFLLTSCATATGDLPGADSGFAREDAAKGQADATVNPNAPDATAIAFDAAASSDAALGSNLDPNLGLPDPAGQVCFTPGSMSECPSIEVCRFYSSNEGRCESCEECGNLNATCTESSQCDILFMCYAGRCTNICPLGTFSCGPIEDCLDIGHPSSGVCDPF